MANLPEEEVTKNCCLVGNLLMKCSLPKEVFYASEEIPVQVSITNNSRRNLRSFNLSIIQYVNMEMINDTYEVKVTKLDTKHGCPLPPGQTLDYEFKIAAISSEKRGVVFDPSVNKTSNTNELFLASSTLAGTGDESEKLGVVVRLRILFYLILGNEMTFRKCRSDMS